MNLREQVESQEPNFNPELNLLGGVFNSPGYHSRIPSGTWVHSTRTNIYYALALLELGDEAYRDRAAAVIRNILALQVTDPYDPAFGIWPWNCEEPVPMMAPPDWNWADFIGAALCHMLKEHRDRLGDGLAAEITAALERAAWSIFRRNVRPGYTNIAIMGAAVTGCAGEVLNNPLLSEYAARRLETFLAYTEEQGGLNEYNSPTYSFVALHETERILQLVGGNRRLIDAARKLHAFIWGELAKQFHPATGQLGGPQSRAYAEYLSANTVAFLSEAAGVPIRRAVPEAKEAGLLSFTYDGVRHLPCPEELRGRFAAVAEPEREIVQRFVRRSDPAMNFIGTTYVTPELIFGSINRECFWTQRRPMLGYWPAGEGRPAMFRMRFLKDGLDFSPAGIRIAQSKNRAVFAVSMLTDRGDWHIGLGRPADGAFGFSKLALRFELAADCAELIDGHILAAGAFRAVIHGLPGSFAGNPVRWQGGRDADRVWVEAVLYEGPEKRLVFDEALKTVAGGGVEILPAEAAAASAGPVLLEDGRMYRVRWGELEVSQSAFACTYD